MSMYFLKLMVMMVFLSGLYMYVLLRKYVLSMLLSLEFMMLGLFIYLFIYMFINNYETYLLIMFLIYVVCEGSLGLAILVSMIRTHGNNYFQSFNILMC